MKGQNSIAARIASARKRLGCNQSALARLIGVTPQCVQQWERSETTPRGKNLAKLAATLQISAQYIQFGSENADGIMTETISGDRTAFYQSKLFEQDYLASIESLLAAGVQMGWLEQGMTAKVKSLADFGLLALRANHHRRG